DYYCAAWDNTLSGVFF
nr:immunoglobulin light chain junction region [Macaca mulatta]MOV69622.1 immunoglobulin light chain junction region [Macaca mulatta]MOV71187.1 immunoglobulin light chain junction region [Macaca mulatta]